MKYCNDKGIACEFANLNGFCSVSACQRELVLPDGRKVLVGKTGKTQLHMTNADRIRAMSDEELLEFMKKSVANAYMCKILRTEPMFLTLEWLQQPAEETADE